MKRYFYLIIVLMCAVPFSACGVERTTHSSSSGSSSKKVTAVRPNTPAAGERKIQLSHSIKKINNLLPIDIEFVQSSKNPQVRITGAADVIDLIKIETSDDALTFKYVLKDNVRLNDVKAYVTLPDLKEVNNYSNGDFNTKEIDTDVLKVILLGTGDMKFATIQCTKLNLVLNGTGDIGIGKVDVTSLRAYVNGTGDIEIKDGKMSSLTGTVNGTGDMTFKRLDLDGADLAMNGTGDLECASLKATRVTILTTGTGVITVAGQAGTAIVNKSGPGRVNLDNLRTDKLTIL